jgi:hypothetical protein
MKRRAPLLVLLLAAAIALAYAPIWRNGFVTLDDPLYITGNEAVTPGLSLASLAWAFRSTAPWSWHPLTWISHQADVALFGLAPAGHHATSLLLHAANAALLFLLLRSLTGWLWRSAAAAALFALHPIHVETVAWAAERKGVLSALFFLAALHAYCGYVRRPGAGRYALVAAALAASLMAKQMAVTLPALLLVLDFWPLGRWRGPGGGRRLLPLLVEKLPLALLAAGGSLVAYLTQSGSGAVMKIATFPLAERLENAAVSYVAYLGAALWPARLACFYPHPGGGIAPARWLAATAFLAAATAVVVAGSRRRPWALAGWLWYLAALLPVLGLVQVGWHARADRYAYLPLIGVYLVAAAALAEAAAGRAWRRAAAGCLAVVVLAALAVTTARQVRVWRDDISLFGHALAVTEENWFAHNNIGAAYFRQGRPDLGTAHYREAFRINRDFAINRPGR